MRILKLRFENLNSLYGEWEIDFTSSMYMSDGIFAITGPTGGGKSTILDAISLALYGRTPRLNNISKNSNEIMSRHASQCSSSVVFETQKGVYCAVWRQHKANKKADGNLVDSTHEISDFTTSKIIETKKRQVVEEIERLTGLDYRRFTRSMLLAQGDFAAFLLTDAGERSMILEQITGTGIYTEISKMVHLVTRDKKGTLAEIQNLLDDVNVMSLEEENQADEKHKALAELASKTIEKLELINNAISWRRNLADFEQRIRETEKKEQFAKEEQKLFEKEKERLVKGQRAAELEADYKELCSVRLELQNKKISLENISKEEIPLLKSIDDSKKKVNDLSQKLKNIRNENVILLKTVQEVRILDNRIDEKRKEYKKYDYELKEQQKELLKKETQLNGITESLNKQINKKNEIELELKNRTNDEPLIRECDLLCDKISQITDLEREIREQEEERDSANNTHEKQKHTLDLLLQKQCEITRDYETHKSDIKKITADMDSILGRRQIDDYRTELEKLKEEKYRRSAVNDYQKERSNLKKGEPCPLCGSLDHPYVSKKLPDLSETDIRLTDVLKIIGQYDLLEKQKKGYIDNLNEKEKELHGIESEIKVFNANSEAYIKSVKKIEADTEKHKIKKQNLLKNLEPVLVNLGIKIVDLKNPDKIMNSLCERRDDYKFFCEAFEICEKELNILKIQYGELDAGIKAITEAVNRHKEKTVMLGSDGMALSKKRMQMFGDKDCDKAESEASAAIGECEVLLEKEKDNHNTLQLRLQKIKTSIETLNKDIDQFAEKQGNLLQDFKRALDKADFSSEDDFVRCRMSAEERREVEKRGMDIQKQLVQVLAYLKELKDEYNKEMSKKLSTSDLNKLLADKEELSKELNEVHEKKGSLQQRIDDNNRAKRERKSRENRQIKAKKEYELWSNLDSLIGSADGKRYRTFAQGLTFGLMVYNANIQLRKMSERYLLVQGSDNPLELNVIDNHQGGIERTTKNLSGGESFIVSLALALGLSRMAGKNVRIDSLFLDEGFGTLDEDTLDVALDTLSSLHSEGKLIGIISHVESLKSRISARIEVKPGTGGRSLLEGPGCKRIG
ncbi:MAG: AAA family ATPase [Spirochaetes bacterium]|nr:AAA family ATPase [Spirochaetota bacterium]